jgi:nicotinamidase-related amidase
VVFREDGRLRILRGMNKNEAAILLIDHQDATVGWISSMPKASTIANTRLLARIGAELDIPLLVTSTMEEQIGTNIKDVQETAPKAYANRIKRGGTLNCFLDPAFTAATKALGRKNLVMAGLTTDICLFHSVVGALAAGYQVQVVADACGSMSALSDASTFDRLRGLGVTVTGGNQLLTELFTDFGTADGQKAMKINLDEIVSKLDK